ncbi:unnamed protein product [Closterium sp. NIES-54]
MFVVPLVVAVLTSFSAATVATAAPAATAAMASPTVLTFDAEGRAVDFDVWVDDLQLFLQCDSRDGVSLFDHTSGVSTAPAATADSTVCSQWTTRDAVARLAVCSHMPSTERALFGQYKTAQSLYESAAAFALVTKLVAFAAHSRLDYAASLVAESASVCPPSVGGECALGTDVLEDTQEDLECLAAAAPHLVSMLLAPEGDPDAPDIPIPRSYAEAIAGEYSSQWQTAMDAEMASWKSTGTYVNEVPPPGANIVSGMWIFRVKRPPGSPPVFKARYVARGFSQRQGVDFFHTFSPTPKMTTLRHRKVHMDAAKRVLRYLCNTSGMGLVLGGRGEGVLTGHSDASWVDDQATQRSSQGYTFSLGSGSVSWRSTHSSSVLGSSCEAEIYATAMAAQELRWLTYVLTDLGERPRSPPVLYVDNKAAIALCQEHRLEHRTKHIALRYFLA